MASFRTNSPGSSHAKATLVVSSAAALDGEPMDDQATPTSQEGECSIIVVDSGWRTVLSFEESTPGVASIIAARLQTEILK